MGLRDVTSRRRRRSLAPTCGAARDGDVRAADGRPAAPLPVVAAPAPPPITAERRSRRRPDPLPLPLPPPTYFEPPQRFRFVILRLTAHYTNQATRAMDGRSSAVVAPTPALSHTSISTAVTR